MKRSSIRLASVLCVIGCLAGACAHGGDVSRNVEPVRLAEKEFERRIIVMGNPVFPQAELRAGLQGVVVSDVEVDSDGHVVSVETLEASTNGFAESVQAELGRAQIAPAAIGENRVRTKGKVTLYFVIRDKQGYALLPDAAGYVGEAILNSRSTNSEHRDERQPNRQ
jgi:TonB-like protein